MPKMVLCASGNLCKKGATGLHMVENWTWNPSHKPYPFCFPCFFLSVD